MEDFEEMDFGEETGMSMGEEARDKMKKLLSAPSKTANYCKAIVTNDRKESDSDFGEGARGISVKIEGPRIICTGCICTKEEYEILCANYNISDTLIGTTVEVLLANGIIFAIR